MTSDALPERAKYPAALESLTSDVAADGTRVFWAKDSFADTAILTAQADYAAPALNASQTLLKEARQRFVFRHPFAGPSYVFKLFPLSFIGSQLRHPKYGYREFSNMRIAANRGVPTPAPIAFLEKRKRGLVSCSGLIQQDFAEHTDLLALARSDAETYTKVMDIASTALCLVFDMGANHIDLRDENIMINLATGDWRIIDWQYASFVAPRAPWLLEYLIAYFIRLAPEKWRAQMLSGWVRDMHTQSNHSTAFELFEKRVKALARRRVKVRHRLALRPVAV